MSDKKTSLKEQLQTARQKLLAAVKDLTDSDWETPVQADGDQWTVLQMLRHLQDAQKGLTGQLERLLANQETVPQDFDVDRWNARIQKKTAEAQMNAEQALSSLEDSLQHLLGVVDSIADDVDWEKTGWQPFLKRMLTTEQFIDVIATHEAQHAEEIEEATKK